jgi:uncharacterized protein YacL
MNIKDRQVTNIIILFGIGFTYWVGTVLYREINKKEINILKNNLLLKCDGWCVSHFFHYLLLGYLAPKYIHFIILIGITFELFEIILHKFSKYVDGKPFSDTITNSLGALTGLIFYKIYPNKIDLYKLFKL